MENIGYFWSTLARDGIVVDIWLTYVYIILKKIISTVKWYKDIVYIVFINKVIIYNKTQILREEYSRIG